MTKKVYVTKAQSRAASAIVQRSAVTGRYVRPGVAKIAAATGGETHSRSAKNGRFVTAETAVRNPKTTVSETRKNGSTRSSSTQRSK